MANSYKPDGYNSVSPYLVVSGAEQTIAFLKKTFDAEELRRYPGKDGGLSHAEVRIDDTVIMLADGSENWQPQPYNVHIYVPDVDAVYRKALEAGAEQVQEPVKKDDPDRRGGVRGPGGVTWWIATMVE